VYVEEELGGSSIWGPWFHFHSFMWWTLWSVHLRQTETQRDRESLCVQYISCVCLEEMMISYMGFSFTSSEYIWGGAKQAWAAYSCVCL
jgi:hypothetical protein